MNELEKELFDEKISGLTKLITTEFSHVTRRFDETEKKLDDNNARINKLDSKLEKLNEDMLEYRMFLKYPKTMIAVIVIIGLLTIASFTKVSTDMFNKEKEKIELEIDLDNIKDYIPTT